MSYTDTQCEKVLGQLKRRPLTSVQIINMGVIRPASVTKRLREGNKKRDPVKIHTQEVGKRRIAKYWLWSMWLKHLSGKY